MKQRVSSMIALFIILVGVLCLFLTCDFKKTSISKNEYDQIKERFKTLHESNKPWCYYYWINDDISKEGVTLDLEAMREVGIGAVLIGNINTAGVDGRVPIFSEAWWGILVHAVNEGKRLGIDIGLFNCPGWSQSGGPWVKPEMAMRYLTYSETNIRGGGKTAINLPKPKKEFQDVYTLAFPVLQSEKDQLTASNTKIKTRPFISNSNNWIDGDLNTWALFKIQKEQIYTIDMQSDRPFTARSLILYPAKQRIRCDVELYVKIKNSFQLIRSFKFDRSNTSITVGPIVHGPVAISIPEIRSNVFRLVCKNIVSNQKQAGFSEIIITANPALENYIEKQLGKMHPTPFPTWRSYLWDQQDKVKQTNLLISPANVLDISDQLDKESGELIWEAPAGDWTVLRIGMTPTGTQNAPAAPQGRGYEVDKANKDFIRYHFEQFVGKFLERIPDSSKSAFKYVVADSYEMGSQNWTDGFEKVFFKNYGYHPKLWLPVISGRIVESVESSERFLWDMRRLIADQIAYEYVGGLREISNQHNLKLWLENYGHWGFPSEFLMYGGQSDLVSGEFWNEGSLGNIECKAASSAAHIYGKPITSAEAFTSAQQSYLRHPALLKKRGDWCFTEGVNHFVLHVYIHQPDETRKPGVNAWFGTEFNRHNTWFHQSKFWIDYIRRCQHMLQQGNYIADVCYFIGEDTPKMTGIRNPEMPDGYSYDYINAEVILKRLTVKNNHFVLPEGISYRILVLPPSIKMRPELLAKIEELVSQGGTVLGPKPEKSPSLENYPDCDQQVKIMADRLWGPDGTSRVIRTYGEGTVLNGMELQEAMDFLKISRDVDINSNSPVLWTHRNLPGFDIYFLSNQSDSVFTITPSFRVNGGKPQLWNAVTGEIRLLNEYTEINGRIRVPIQFQPRQSCFIVITQIDDKSIEKGPQKNLADMKIVQMLDLPWKVTFQDKNIGPEETITFDTLLDWTKHTDNRIKYYSGTASYKTKFFLNKLPANDKLYLNLGNVKVMARVKINGNEIGAVWMAPYVLNTNGYLKIGENSIETEVVNLWRNRMVRDKQIPKVARKTWTIVDDVDADEVLQPSGLLGPVTIELIENE